MAGHAQITIIFTNLLHHLPQFLYDSNKSILYIGIGLEKLTTFLRRVFILLRNLLIERLDSVAYAAGFSSMGTSL